MPFISCKVQERERKREREFVVTGMIICSSVKRTKDSDLPMSKVDVFNEF